MNTRSQAKRCPNIYLRAWLPVLLLICSTALTPALAQTTPEIADKVLASTVSLEMQDATGATVSYGSGFCVRWNLIATNYHVIEGTRRGTATRVGKYTEYTIEGVVATDEANDLALLKITASGMRPLALGYSENVRIGDAVYVCGNPKGLEGTFSDGLISSRRGGAAKTRFQMTAPISPGSSGGPVVNARGEVIGVSFMTLEGGQNLNFAIPSKYLRRLLAKTGPVKPLSSASSGISAETYLIRGNQQVELGDYAAAIALYNLSIIIEPENEYAYIRRGMAKYNIGRYSAAIADYDTAIHMKPDYAFIYVQRGFVKHLLGQHFSAIADYDAAIRIEPDDAYAYLWRGDAKAALGRHFSAIADYDAAIRIEPDDAYAYVSRGIAKAKLGQHFSAIADYDAAIRIKPDYAIAYYNRAVSKVRLNREAEAKQDLYTARRLAEKAGDADVKATVDKALNILR